MKDIIYREDAINALEKLSACKEYGVEVGTDEETYIGKYEAITAISDLPSADRPKHYCAECKFKSIDKRCMPCSSCISNPKNRDAFVSCEVEKNSYENSWTKIEEGEDDWTTQACIEMGR